FLRGSGTDSSGWTSTGNGWPLTINMENNDATFGGRIYTLGNGEGLTVQGAAQYQGISIRNTAASASAFGGSYIDFKNEQNISTTGVQGHHQTGGNADLVFHATGGGSRTADRREEVFRMTTSDNTSYRRLYTRSTTPTNDVWSGAIEIREVNWIGSSTDNAYAPSITFHWSGKAASALKMYDDASFRFISQGSTGNSYRQVHTGDLYLRNGAWLRPSNGASGIYWEDYARGLTVANNGSNYGNVNIYGSGNNAWCGYSIHNWIDFMANGSGAGSMRGFYSADNGGWLMYWDSNNNATFGGNITAYSDERLKQNKRPIDNVKSRREGMAKASMLYERDGLTRVGFGAQTLELAVPEVVKTSDDLLGTKSVNYMDMVAILAADNQQQEERIIELETENAQLREMFAALENRLTKAGI
ncbi:bZIP transcription factor, partial [Sphingobium sp. LSP13-1-1.1]|uniref:bZIP transcription factor n=1 Tax=Sphingobium sp. LSP13-1-1.1 TaxID=3135234 RepID=UPI003449B27A